MRTLIRSRRVALPLAALALAGTGFVAYGAVADEGAGYRTVAAGVGDVDQVLSLSGVVGASGRSDLAFGTDGTVAKVPVEQGDEVEQGDVIAVLDRAALRAAADRAQSDLAAAKAQLADDKDAQTDAVASATESSDDAASAPAAAPSTAEPARESGQQPSNGPLLAQLAAQQDAVLTAQSAASAALATAAAALTTQEQACTVAEAPAESTESGTDHPAGERTDAGTDGPSSELSDECAAALASVQSAQSATATAQTALQTALEELGGTLTAALGSVGTDNQSDAGDTPESTGTPESTASPVTRTVTAATLAADQAAIDRAAAELASARASLRATVVRAPADGKVVSLAVAPGDRVAGGDAVAVVVAPGLTTVSLAVTATQAAQLAVDTEVDVTPAGATDALTGTISRVENIPSSETASGSDTTYPVEVVLDERDLALPDGIPASVAVVVGRAEDVVTVPASAVVDGVVTVLEAGRPQQTPVTTGIVGSTRVEVVDGLEAGAEVVLADLGADLPTGETQDQGPGGVRFGDGGSFTGGVPPVGGPPGR